VADKDPVQLLQGVPLFSGCTKRELQAIAAATKEVRHKAGAVIAREGESGVGFFLIMDGTARISVGGKTKARLGSGDYFGEIALLDEGPRSATVTADTDLRLLGLTAWNFRRLMVQNPSIGPKLLKVMGERLRESSRDVKH
jgi:CRP/FNR family transcriptional regulator, cyclic AMP receptor protein